jgi:lipopolysaccharide cholinephosphotransferase
MTTYFNDWDEIIPDTRPADASNLRQGQMVMLRLLKILHKACQDLGLTYWLCGGTLIGAIRHDGFIPWDDDVDVFMPRDHYEEFKHRAGEVLPYDVYLQTDTPWIRLVDRFGTKEIIEGNEFIFIDIFPAARFPLGRKTLRKAWMLIPPYPLPGIPETVSIPIKVRRMLIRWAAIFIRISGLTYVIRLLCCIGSRRYWSYDLAVTWRFFYRDDWIFPLRLHRFEDTEFYIPADYEKVLRHQFGDYMTPPPESSRKTHNHIAFHTTKSNGHPLSLDWERYAEKKQKAALFAIAEKTK